MFHVAINEIGKSECIIYYPGDDKCCIYNSQLKLKVGDCGTFEFSVPSTNILYSELKEWAIVTVYRDNVEFWRGYISEISTDYLGNASVYCVEDLGWLNYEVYAPAKGNATRQALLEAIIDTYNSKSGIQGTDKAFEVGAVYFGGTDEIAYEFNYDDTILSCLRKIAGDLYARVRRTNGIRYIDLLRLDDYPTENEQYIQFGYNLLNYTKEMNTSEMLNVIYPYGAETGSEVYEGLTQRLAGSEYSDQTSIGKYGRIAKNVIFEDMTVLADLNAKAQEYLQKHSQPRLTLELNALDMSELGTSTSKLDLGDNIRVIAEPYGIDQWIRITEFVVNIQDLSKNQYTLSDTVQKNKTLTEQTIDSAQKVEAMPIESEILNAAKKNAVALLTGSDGGYLSFIFDENGQMNGFQITDTQDVTQATKKWMWNEAGLGFLYIDDDGNWQTNNAMTSNGQIVAERITAGKLTGQTIEGATIKTLTNGSVQSERTDGSSVTISGGMLSIENTDDSYLNIKHKNGDRVTFGGSQWGCYNGSGWIWLDPWDVFEYLNNHI